MPGSAQPEMPEGITRDYVESIAAGKDGTFTDAERTESLERFHELYGCIFCGARHSGCTATRCTRQEYLEKVEMEALERYTERARESYNAGSGEINRRLLAAAAAVPE